MRISADITQVIFVFVFLICICEKEMWLTSRRSYLTPSLPLKTASTGVDSEKIIIYYYHYYSLLHYYLIIYLTSTLIKWDISQVIWFPHLYKLLLRINIFNSVSLSSFSHVLHIGFNPFFYSI